MATCLNLFSMNYITGYSAVILSALGEDCSVGRSYFKSKIISMILLKKQNIIMIRYVYKGKSLVGLSLLYSLLFLELFFDSGLLLLTS